MRVEHLDLHPSSQVAKPGRVVLDRVGGNNGESGHQALKRALLSSDLEALGYGKSR